MKTANVAEAVKSEHAVALLKQMYGENRVEENAARYQLVADGFAKEFGDKAFEFFSAPGRTEIGGNHTDHKPRKSPGRKCTSGLCGSSCTQRNPHCEPDQ